MEEIREQNKRKGVLEQDQEREKSIKEILNKVMEFEDCYELYSHDPYSDKTSTINTGDSLVMQKKNIQLTQL